MNAVITLVVGACLLMCMLYGVYRGQQNERRVWLREQCGTATLVGDTLCVRPDSSWQVHLPKELISRGY